MLDKQGYTHASACTRPPPRAHSRARTHTHNHRYVIFIAFPLQQWFANAPQCYIIRKLAVLQFVRWITETRSVLETAIRPAHTLKCNSDVWFNHTNALTPFLNCTELSNKSGPEKQMGASPNLWPICELVLFNFWSAKLGQYQDVADIYIWNWRDRDKF